MVRFSRTKCPPGTFCLSTELIGLGLLVVGGVAGYFMSAGPRAATAAAAPIVVERPAPRQPPIHINVESGDDRYTRAPKPERDWLARPDMSAVFNAPTFNGTLPAVATRGIPESYQSMGVLTTEDGQALPLYGRRTGARSDRFQYYTRTDTYNPVQLPISYKRRDCQDDVGCEELMDGEEIKIPTTGKTAKATLYRFSGPTYVPIA